MCCVVEEFGGCVCLVFCGVVIGVVCWCWVVGCFVGGWGVLFELYFSLVVWLVLGWRIGWVGGCVVKFEVWFGDLGWWWGGYIGFFVVFGVFFVGCEVVICLDFFVLGLVCSELVVEFVGLIDVCVFCGF